MDFKQDANPSSPRPSGDKYLMISDLLGFNNFCSGYIAADVPTLKINW